MASMVAADPLVIDEGLVDGMSPAEKGEREPSSVLKMVVVLER